MTDHDALLPCPFCGHQAKLIQSGEAPGKYGSPSWTVMCDFPFQPCFGGFINLWMQTPEEAIAAWNRRAHPAPAATGEGVAVAWVLAHADDMLSISRDQETVEGWRRKHPAYAVRPLVYGDTTPAQQGGAVTEAMVEAGGFAVATIRAEQTAGCKYSYWRKRKDDCRAIARAAIYAALNPGGERATTKETANDR